MMWILSLLFAMQAGSTAPRTIAHSELSYVDEPRLMVARTDADWASLWKAHAGDTPAPKVNFATTTVVAVFLGSRMSSGFDVQITGTHPQGAALVVEWTEKGPGRGDVSAQIITAPAHIVAIPRFEGEIRFEKTGK